MLFDLHVTFAGLCLLSLHGGQLHVMLPNTGDNSHRAVVVYSAQHENPAADEDSLVVLSLEGREIDLTGLPSSGRPSMRRHWRYWDIVNLSGNLEVKRYVPLALLRPGTSADVRARVRLSTGSLVKHEPGARWRVDRRRARHMATAAEWKIPRAGETEFFLTLRGDSTETRRLRPIRGSKKIHIYVMHVPDNEVPENGRPLPGPIEVPQENDTTHHFASYYRLTRPRTPVSLPVFESVDRRNLRPTFAPALRIGREFTCILARAEPEGQ